MRSIIGSQFDELLQTDTQIYRRLYASTTENGYLALQELKEALCQRYDIVHLFCDVSPSGIIADSSGGRITGTELIEKCCDSNVKLLWIASDNQADGYIKGFKARGKRLNLVMTINRNGSRFSDFLEKLLFRMFYGDTMPIAWVDLCPQRSGTSDLKVPNSIFFAGRAGVKLR